MTTPLLPNPLYKQNNKTAHTFSPVGQPLPSNVTGGNHPTAPGETNPSGPVIGRRDADRNVWNYKTFLIPRGAPFLPKKVTYLVNQDGVNYQDWFQHKFGIDAGGKPTDPAQLPTDYGTPTKAEIAQNQHHAPPAAAHTVSTKTPQGNPLGGVPGVGNVKVDPKLLAAVQNAMSGGSLQGLGVNASVPKLPTIDPTQYGNKLAQMQSAPLLANLQAQLGGVQSILPGQMANLNKWYGAVGQQADQGAASDNAAYQQAAASSTNDAQKLISSLSGGDSGAGYALAQQAQNNDNSLNAQQANQAGINNALKTNIAQSLAGAKDSTQTQNNAMRGDIMGQIAQALSAAGTTREQGYEQGLQLQSQLATQGLQNRSVAQNMKLAAALAGPQIAAANLANLATGQNITNNNLTTALGVAKTKHDMAIQDATTRSGLLNDSTQRFLATHPGANQKTFAQNLNGDPSYRAAVHAAVWRGGMVDANGRMAANPQRSYQLLLETLKGDHPDTPASVIARFAKDEVDAAMPTSIYANKWKWGGSGYTKK